MEFFTLLHKTYNIYTLARPQPQNKHLNDYTIALLLCFARGMQAHDDIKHRPKGEDGKILIVMQLMFVSKK